MNESVDVVWLGRGGQGAVTAASLLAQAAVLRGKYALAIPFFGAERRGAPVFAYTRIADGTILSRARVKRGDILAVLDPSLLGQVNVESLLKPGGRIVINTGGRRIEVGARGEAYCVDAVSIADSLGLRLAGIVLVNMPMVGAVGRVYGGVGLPDLESAVKEVIKVHVERNVEAVKRGWEGVGHCE
ncbi:2-oxoacid:acceptor oxidoreductase family protein [Thermofilum pendens]|uniref:pyruvate synthase n=1 Tax=Thermofilum pendens (strain DSM 2475 / Hrk 5) TaxID=368408 RepID=A1RXL6_THEPD|nr:2-oxoacid:acceptor oxidoreductase family protein [Thermofilum pendens]ABL77946.1 pyruvate/ketoisovalerate oxidoreductase, gamma subunit [Thermofilum pendens Hrk 5]